MNVGSLFSGIGGLDLGLERAGATVVWQSEIQPFACRVLKKHWPDVPNLGDITTIDWSTVEPVDLICGGYPCQPFSSAGQRAGTDDRRHLWPYFLDAIRELRPRFALMENVTGHLSLGFGRVLGDLAEIGYDCEWDCIPAAAVGAPHVRDRVFIVAYPNGRCLRGVDANPRDGRSFPPEGVERIFRGSRSSEGVMAHTDSAPPNAQPSAGSPWSPVGERGGWPVEPTVGRVVDGVSAGLDRTDRLRALGNAVVPQVAEFVGRRLMEAP